jgi:hypothetical protein
MTTLPFSRPLTRADLELMPDDGHRYELIDGVLIVSPGPQLPHQDVVGNLYSVARVHPTGRSCWRRSRSRWPTTPRSSRT